MPLYRDLHGLELTGWRDHLALAILKFHLLCFDGFHQPIKDIKGVKSKYPRSSSLWEYMKMGGAALITPFLVMQSARFYAKRFKNPRIRALLGAVVEPSINALSLIYTLSTFTMGDSGYPKGGSLQMARNIAAHFEGLGGEIRYRTQVQEVLRTDSAWSVRVGEELLQADAVVISMDSRSAIDKLFKTPIRDSWAQKMRKGLRTTQCMFLGVGVKADLRAWPRSMQIVLPEPLQAAGRTYNTIVVNNYADVNG